jgi:DNA-binding CsgD family transcriptional regulator
VAGLGPEQAFVAVTEAEEAKEATWKKEAYLSTAIQKLGVRNRTEAVRIAREKGWL